MSDRIVRFQILKAATMIALKDRELGLEYNPDYSDLKLFVGTPFGNKRLDYIHPNHVGDVVSISDGLTTIAPSAVTNAKMANMAANTVKGRVGSNGAPQDLTMTDLRSMLGLSDGPTNIQPGGGLTSSQDGNVLTISMGTPGDVTSSTMNAIGLGTHTHALNNTGVSAGTYRSLTVDVKGRVIAGTNPTTLTGYGITDAVQKGGDTMTGLLILSGNPVQNMGAATKLYVDTVASSLEQLQPGTGLTKLDGKLNVNFASGTTTLTSGGTGVAGSSTNSARQDHTHTLPAYPAGNATHTGDVTGSTALTISQYVVSNDKLSMAPANTIKGRISSGGEVQDLTAAQVRQILNVDPSGTVTYTHPNHTGDVTSIGDGATIISNGAVTNAKMANMTGDTIKGRLGSSGAPQDLTISQIKSLLNVTEYTHPNHTGDVISAGDGATTISNGSVTNTKIANSTITNAKLVDMSAYSLKGRLDGSGVPQDISFATLEAILEIPEQYVHPNHTGDVTSVADGATTIANSVVTLAKMANLAANSIIGNNTASARAPLALTVAQTKTMLGVPTFSLVGTVLTITLA